MINFSDLIWTTENALTDEFCEHVINKFEERVDDQEDGVTGSGYVPNVKQSKDIHLSSYDAWKPEDDVFYKSLNKHFNIYREHLGPNTYCELAKDCNDVGYQLQRTEPGQFYTWHHDSIPYYFDGQLKQRAVTFIWYLNDVDEGGYTEFIDGTKIQPERGRILFFPATWTYMHRGFPPKSNTKCICTGWMYTDYSDFSGKHGLD